MKQKGVVSIYNRNQENNISKYADIISSIEYACCDTAKNSILDCEAVAWDKETKEILPFQILSTTKRKDANKVEIKVQFCVFMFHLLYLNDKPLIEESLAERR